MRRTNMGLLCRSQASTAVCAAGDPRCTVVEPIRTRRSISDHRHHSAADLRRRLRQAVTLPMLTKTQHIPSLPIHNELFQVVVMRVSIHCQGCAGKVRKHISKMEGVTSYSIDLESKRVTVMGHVSPLEVLESISKVKKAEFWSC